MSVDCQCNGEVSHYVLYRTTHECVCVCHRLTAVAAAAVCVYALWLCNSHQGNECCIQYNIPLRASNAPKLND